MGSFSYPNIKPTRFPVLWLKLTAVEYIFDILSFRINLADFGQSSLCDSIDIAWSEIYFRRVHLCYAKSNLKDKI